MQDAPPKPAPKTTTFGLFLALTFFAMPIWLSNKTKDNFKTELIKEDREYAYPLYELKFPGLSPEGLFDGNFARIKVEGEYRKRICSIQVYDEIGKEVFKKRIHQTEISY